METILPRILYATIELSKVEAFLHWLDVFPSHLCKYCVDVGMLQGRPYAHHEVCTTR